MKKFMLVILLILTGCATRPSRNTGEPIDAYYKNYLLKEGIQLNGRRMRYIGNKEGIGAPFLHTSDGGVILIGDHMYYEKSNKRKTQTSVVIKFDSQGQIEWRKTFITKDDKRAYESETILNTNDGNFIFFRSMYPTKYSMGVDEFIKIDPKGRVIWKCKFKGSGGRDTPYAQKIQLLDNGSIEATGHIYPKQVLEKNYHNWRGVIDQKGRIRLSETGERQK